MLQLVLSHSFMQSQLRQFGRSTLHSCGPGILVSKHKEDNCLSHFLKSNSGYRHTTYAKSV